MHNQVDMPSTAPPTTLLSRPLPAPDFVLPDHRGQQFDLLHQLTQAPLILVFFRGHWCPFCRRYLSKLQSHLPELESYGPRLAAISPESPHTCAHLSSELQLTFPLLSDENLTVIDQYGVRNRNATSSAMLPHPAVFLIDQLAQIRFRSIDRNYKKRTPIRRIRLAIEELTSEVGPPAAIEDPGAHEV